MTKRLKASWAFAGRRRELARWKRGWSGGPRLVAGATLKAPGKPEVHPMARRGPGDLGPARHVLAQVPAMSVLLDPPLDVSPGRRPPAPQTPEPGEQPPPGMMLDPFAGAGLPTAPLDAARLKKR